MTEPLLTDSERDVLRSAASWSLTCPGQFAENSPSRCAAAKAFYDDHRDQHAHAEICIALTRSMTVGLGESVYRMTPGSVLIAPPFTDHQNGYLPSRQPGSHIWIALTRRRALAMVVDLTGKGSHLRENLLLPSEEAGVLPERLFTETTPEVSQGLRIRAALLNLAGTLLDADEQRDQEASSTDFQRAVIDTITIHIEENTGRGISLDILARMAGYSKYHFHRLFVKHAGCTPQQYIDRCRRRRMEELLQEGWTKAKISQALGFSAPQAFARWYKNQGCSK
ncbi:MAG: helix-turn-helix transcriptional regulator [Planctomycetota bacterium]|jgi:AraC-like DNA-binding protein